MSLNKNIEYVVVKGMIRRMAGVLSAVSGRGMLMALAICASSIVFSPASAAAGQTGDVVRVRLGGDAQQTRIVIELDKSVAGKQASRDDDYSRQVIALPDIRLGDALSGQGTGLIAGWRVESIAGSTRINLNFKSKARIYRRFLLPPADGISVYRYVIDIVPQNGDPAADSNSPIPVVSSQPSTQVETPVAPHAKKIIVIDAGHGGKDPGAHGKGSLEKDDNLAAARSLRDALEATGRYKVIMTRDTDAFVDLTARVRIARTANADLFISLHSDSGGDGSATGASIYTLSDSGTERAARKALVKGDWSLSDTTSSDAMVNRILVDLTQRATKNRSAVFAGMVMDHIGASTPLLKSNLRQAGFMVLLAPDVPAVLLEMGYINNDHDEGMLADSHHREVMMGEVAAAIDQYFENDTLYASVIGTR